MKIFPIVAALFYSVLSGQDPDVEGGGCGASSGGVDAGYPVEYRTKECRLLCRFDQGDDVPMICENAPPEISNRIFSPHCVTECENYSPGDFFCPDRVLRYRDLRDETGDHDTI